MNREVAAGIAIWTALAALAGALGFGWRFMVGVLAGGTVTFFNYWWFSSLVRGLLSERATARSFGLKIAGKELLLFGVVGALIALKLVDGIAFLVGLSSLVVSVVIMAARWKARGGKL